jgi:puromycin-sensitive aminopeptidase
MEWWTDLWLNEGFASWMEYFCIDSLFPSWSIWDSYLSAHHTYTFLSDSVINSHPVEVEVEDPSDIDEIFDAISYSKGSCVIRMIQAYLGDLEFRKGLSKYLKKYSYGNAVTKNLWEELSAESGKNVEEMMSQWALQTGFPCIQVKSIKPDPSTNSVTLELSQRRYLLNGPQEKEQTKWSLPISVVTPGGGSNHSSSSSSQNQPSSIPLLLERDSKVTIQLPSSGDSNKSFKLNAGQVYLYRVLYPLSHYPVLKSTLFSYASPSDRLGVQNDLFAFVRAGCLPFQILAEFIEEYCLHETNENVWADLSTNLLEFASVIQFSDSPATKFAHWMCILLEQVWIRLGTWNWQGSSEGQNALRARILKLLVEFGHESTIRECARRFYRFIQSEAIMPQTEQTQRDFLPPDLREGVYAAVVSSGGILGFELLLERFRTLTNHAGAREEIVKCLHALAHTKEKSLITQALTLSLDDPLVRVEDASGLLYAIACNPIGTHLFWDFMKKRWTTILENFEGAFCLPKIVGALAQFNADSQAAEVAAFYKKNKAVSF